LLSLGERAFELRLIGAAVATQRYTVKPADIARVWDAVAIGDFRNIARAQAATALANRGAYDAAADRVAALVADLDLRAAPPQLQQLQYQVQSSRRGQAGWQLVWATWRDRVLAGNSFEHVVALMPLAPQHPIDLPAILARAAALADGDTARVLHVAQLATAYNQPALAQQLVEPLVKANPTRELLQLAGGMAQRHGRVGDALAYFEQAQAAGEDEAVNLSTVRSELGQIIATARQLAVQSQGAARQAAVAKAMVWATRWRAIDPGNPQIDTQLGELLLAVGDTAGAWRQLSTVIERDPMEGTGYQTVADAFERQGRVAEALEYWDQAVVIDQTNPTHRIRKAQALIALGRAAEGDAILEDVANRKWHDRWINASYQAKELLQRGKQKQP
jgi:predicted Zn-dependent protease